DVAAGTVQRERLQALVVIVGPVEPDSVRRPVQQDGTGLAPFLGDVDGGVEALAIAHRDAVLVFRVMGFDLRRPLGLRLLRGGAGGKDCGQHKQSQYGTAPEHHSGSLISADLFREDDSRFVMTPKRIANSALQLVADSAPRALS